MAVSLILPVMGMYGTGSVYAASNTKSGSASDVVAVASAQKHGTDGSKYIKWLWKDNKKHQWCAAFVSWCANEAGAASAVPKNGGCKQMYKDVISAGGTVVKTPQAGDLLFYHINGKASNEFCHVGIVTKVSKSRVDTVQGNLDNQVYNTIKANGYKLSSDNSKAYNYTIVYVRPNYNDSDTDISASDAPAADSSQNSSSSSSASSSATVADLGGVTVNIVNKASGKALDVYGSNTSSSNKSNVDITALNSSNKSSQFKFTKTSKNWYSISPVSNSKLAVNPYSDKPKNGTNVNVYTKNTSDKTQGWVVKKVGDHYVILSAYNKSLALTAAGTGDHSNVKVATYSEGNSKQLWSLKLTNGQDWGTEAKKEEVKDDTSKEENSGSTPSVDDTSDINGSNSSNTGNKEENNGSSSSDTGSSSGTASLVSGTKYFICNKASGKALDVYGNTSSSTNKSNVQIYELKKSSKSSQFKVTKTSGGWYSIAPVSNTKLAVNPYSDKPADGTNVNVYTKDTGDKTQGWIFEKSGDYYIIRSAYKKSLVLTAAGTSDMSNVKIATYSSGNSKQLWKLIEV